MTKRKRRSTASSERWTSDTLAELGMSVTKQRIVIGVGSAVALIASALVLTFVVNMIGAGDVPPARAGAGSLGGIRPAEYQAWRSLKQFAPIAYRKADAQPLTPKELFGARTVTAGKITLRRVGFHLDPGCREAVWGADLVEELSKAGCTQIARGLYTSADGAYVAQYAMLNLADVTAADGLVEQLKALHLGGWVLPIESAKAKFTGYTESSGQAMGHYVGLVWIGRTDGAEPGPGDDFVTLGLAVREVERAIYKRVVAVAGVPTITVKPAPGEETAQPAEPAPADASSSPSASPSPASQ
ncbi:hypothetical protein [Microtetraspora sp. NBRC 16547]|uniref:hypothetical protein n=1 Tax=Microtetraspora sp. NBRC 16547 TaxID=3030993 RepID=UPI0024A5BE0B|nr:hypothetical protein [Microtetraspora sp. NBRC 16547]GLW97374.1 hypothetical protein Misp02_14610 [Microtetraspora sp. NBRC 16547]